MAENKKDEPKNLFDELISLIPRWVLIDSVLTISNKENLDLFKVRGTYSLEKGLSGPASRCLTEIYQEETAVHENCKILLKGSKNTYMDN